MRDAVECASQQASPLLLFIASLASVPAPLFPSVDKPPIFLRSIAPWGNSAPAIASAASPRHSSAGGAGLSSCPHKWKAESPSLVSPQEGILSSCRLKREAGSPSLWLRQ